MFICKLNDLFGEYKTAITLDINFGDFYTQTIWGDEVMGPHVIWTHLYIWWLGFYYVWQFYLLARVQSVEV